MLEQSFGSGCNTVRVMKAIITLNFLKFRAYGVPPEDGKEIEHVGVRDLWMYESKWTFLNTEQTSEISKKNPNGLLRV